ncbi:MAG: asparagine synthase (glutamine-hydrolyzing), partial [Planctomycetota bacterium]
AGIAWTNERPCVDARARVERMASTIAHRGPDGNGRIDAPFVCVGFRRLAIVDLQTGEQPVANEDGTVQVLLNGEIYNHGELRRWLQERGHTLTGGSDASVLPHLYEELGEDFVTRLDGMFAICVVDRLSGRTLLYRDRLGIKPLLHARTPGGLVFASELKAIMASGLVDRTVDRASLLGALNGFYTPGPCTLIEGVRKLAPGAMLAIDCFGRVTDRSWHSIEPTPVRSAAAPDLAHVDTLLERAVAARVEADVPVGISLSGGLDSSLLAAYVARCAGTRVTAFTVACDGADRDEIDCARRVAAHLDLEHVVIDAPAADYLADVPRLVWESDEPLTDPAYFTARRIAGAASSRVKVLLLGAGADEIFAGYHHYDYRLRHRITERMPSPALLALARAFPNRTGLREAATFGPRRLGGHAAAMSTLTPAERASLQSAWSGWRDPIEHIRDGFEAAGAVSDLDRQLFADTQTYLPGQVLPTIDRATMAASIEGRVPYLDHAIVEHAFTIHGRYKFDRSGRRAAFGPKAILKRLAADLLPPEVVRRRKAGFPSPVLGWMPTTLFPVLRHAIEREDSLTRRHLPADWVRRRLATPTDVAAGAGFAHTLLWLELWHEWVINRASNEAPDMSAADLLAIPRTRRNASSRRAA